MKYIFLFTSFFLTEVLHGQPMHSLWIRVSEESMSGKKIKFAEVEVTPLAQGHATLSTTADSNGLAYFPQVPEGVVELCVRRSGFEDFCSYDYKITGQKDNYSVRLRRLPNQSYYLRGQVMDTEGRFLPGVSVQFETPFVDPAIIQTDSFGSFKFIADGENITPDMECSLSFKKTGYSDFQRKYNFLRRDLPIINITMSEVGEKKKPRQTGWSIGMSGELNSFISDVPNNHLKFAASYDPFIMYRFKWFKYRIHAGFGVNIKTAAHLKTVNFFETLNGNQSEIESGYNVRNLASLMSRFYYKPQAASLIKYSSPFIGFSAQLMDIDSVENNYILGQLSATSTIESGQKILPRVSFGYSFHWKVFVIEPAFSYTFFDLKSQNFKFNYFGNSEPFEEKNNFHRIDLSISLRILLLSDSEL